MGYELDNSYKEETLNYDDDELSDNNILDSQERQYPRWDKDNYYDEDDNFFNSGDGYDSPMDRHGDLLKELTDFDGYIKETISGWLGLIWDVEQGKYVRDKYLIPIMNKPCANWCITFLRTYARKNNIITYIRENDYKDMREDIIDTIWLNIPSRKKEFGIENDGDVLRICTELEHASILALMGAGGGKYTDFMAGTMRHNTTEHSYPYNPNNPSQKQGVVKRFKNWLLG